MKKLFFLLTITVFFTNLNAQLDEQQEYTAYLEQALDAVKHSDGNNFTLNFKYFVTALDSDNITPEMLTKKNFDLFSQCIDWGMANIFGVVSELLTDKDLKTNLLDFLQYDIENHPSNMIVLGHLYCQGVYLQRDCEKAKYWFEKAADKENTEGMIFLGGLYENGEGVSQDYAKAAEWYQKAIEKGDYDGMHHMGSLYEDSEKIYSKAIEWYEKAAEKGEARSMIRLGFMYYHGEGKTQDYTKAKKWFEKAAEINDTEGMLMLGVLYKDGLGTPQDYEKALGWFRKACEASGIGCDDYRETFYAWKEAEAEKGDADAMNTLGNIYANGYGEIPQDFKKAKEWFEKSAEKGNADAMDSLGYLYEEGSGVTQDFTKAKEWYQKACEAGNEDSCQNYEDLK